MERRSDGAGGLALGEVQERAVSVGVAVGRRWRGTGMRATLGRWTAAGWAGEGGVDVEDLSPAHYRHVGLPAARSRGEVAPGKQLAAGRLVGGPNRRRARDKEVGARA